MKREILWREFLFGMFALLASALAVYAAWTIMTGSLSLLYPVLTLLTVPLGIVGAAFGLITGCFYCFMAVAESRWRA